MKQKENKKIQFQGLSLQPLPSRFLKVPHGAAKVNCLSQLTFLWFLVWLLTEFIPVTLPRINLGVNDRAYGGEA